MDTNSHFKYVYEDLGIAEERLDNLDYDSSLEALCKAYGHVRALLEKVHKLQALKIEVESPAGEDVT